MSRNRIAHDEQMFRHLVHHAAKGERITYHVGDLANDRDNSERIRRLADCAMRLSNALLPTPDGSLQLAQGLVLLTQRRIGPGMWEYIAVKL